MEKERTFPHIRPELFKQVWQALKKGEKGRDSRWSYMAKSIETHKEFIPFLEGKQKTLPPGAPDPFLHLTLHTVVEELLAENELPEIGYFYDIQKKHGLSHHEIVHMLGAILTTQLFTIFKEQKFDIEFYKQILKEYAHYTPDVFWKKIEEG